MISLIEDNFQTIMPLCNNNPFGCRIYSLIKTYSPQLSFVDYWVQIVDEKAVSVIARLETVFILRLTKDSNIEEISSFLRVSGATSIICDGKYYPDLPLLSRKEGLILQRISPFVFDCDYDVDIPTVKEVYDIISSCASKEFNVPPYESFMLDVSHKLNNKSIRIIGTKDNCVFKACIMTLAESTDSAVLGALATIPTARNKGYGSYLIKYLCNQLIAENKTVYLHRAMNENIEFYNKLGFVNYGMWAEYTIKE